MIKRFAPFYNKVRPPTSAKLTPLRVLVSTDVLSEGVNLQDGTLSSTTTCTGTRCA